MDENTVIDLNNVKDVLMKMNWLAKKERELFNVMTDNKNYDTFKEHEACVVDLVNYRRLFEKMYFVPERYYEKTALNYIPDDCDVSEVEKVKDYMANIDYNIREGFGLVISGPNGNGKTHIYYTILKQCVLCNYEVKSIDFAVAKNLSFEDRAKIIRECEGADIIGIDDLRTEASNEYVIEFLFSIINLVYNQRSSLLITTNLSGNEFRNRYGNSVYSRIYEMMIPVALNGTDKRKEVKR